MNNRSPVTEVSFKFLLPCKLTIYYTGNQELILLTHVWKLNLTGLSFKLANGRGYTEREQLDQWPFIDGSVALWGSPSKPGSGKRTTTKHSNLNMWHAHLVGNLELVFAFMNYEKESFKEVKCHLKLFSENKPSVYLFFKWI